MIINPVAQNRPDWYDRNAVNKTIVYSSNGISPHTDTIRNTYTVGANKKALLGGVCLTISRATVATTVDLVVAYLRYTPSGETGLRILEVRKLTNVVGESGDIYIFANMILVAGDNITIRTEDPSTGGTCNYRMTAVITEYDA